nr:hypothetical protein [Candidatus Sigynarchaeota archaeon]
MIPEDRKKSTNPISQNVMERWLIHTLTGLCIFHEPAQDSEDLFSSFIKALNDFINQKFGIGQKVMDILLPGMHLMIEYGRFTYIVIAAPRISSTIRNESRTFIESFERDYEDILKREILDITKLDRGRNLFGGFF